MRKNPQRGAVLRHRGNGSVWWLGEREMVVDTGEAADFATMTPHAIVAIERPSELSRRAV
jgi:hypothetical protein